jgi:hypothetical protein
MKTLSALVVMVLVSFTSAFAQHSSMPAGMSHEEHMKQMAKDEELKKRGAAAMGFDQEATTHHFLLSADGGSIGVASNNLDNVEAVAQVRAHLKEIAQAFAAAQFNKPFATHGEVPPGVPVMQAQKSLIRYQYEERPGGGRVVIKTSDAAALNAIHEFLRYQIVEHKTGDPLTVSR